MNLSHYICFEVSGFQMASSRDTLQSTPIVFRDIASFFRTALVASLRELINADVNLSAIALLSTGLKAGADGEI